MKIKREDIKVRKGQGLMPSRVIVPKKGKAYSRKIKHKKAEVVER